MPSGMNRRDFLKLASYVPLGMAMHPYLRMFNPSQLPQDGRKNVLIVVFDAFSAYHIPLYGYGRATTPNIARLAQRAIVYNKHYAGGNFTTPGTATLLTGALPWSHRAFQLNGTVTPSFANKNIFQAFDHYYRIVYSHNPLVNTLFKQFSANLDDYVPWSRLLLTSDGLIDQVFQNDDDIASVAWERAIKKGDGGYSYSLFLSNLYEKYVQNKIAAVQRFFPEGLPSVRTDNYFLLEDAIDWLQAEIGKLPQPFLGYFHFMPPHAPSATHIDFYKHFQHDGLQVPTKPNNPFSEKLFPSDLMKKRTDYDEFILYLDREFGRLFDHLESSGILENTYVLLTSDHGELFERGTRGHTTPQLYQPVVRIPLMIFEPGRTTRTDIHATTSAADILPTLLHLTGHNPASWAEGTILPPFASTEPSPDRPIYALHAKENDPNAPLTVATAMLVKGRYKLTWYFGYPELGEGNEIVELFDIQKDPQELQNLFTKRKAIGKALLAELKQKVKESDRPNG